MWSPALSRSRPARHPARRRPARLRPTPWRPCPPCRPHLAGSPPVSRQCPPALLIVGDVSSLGNWTFCHPDATPALWSEHLRVSARHQRSNAGSDPQRHRDTPGRSDVQDSRSRDRSAHGRLGQTPAGTGQSCENHADRLRGAQWRQRAASGPVCVAELVPLVPDVFRVLGRLSGKAGGLSLGHNGALMLEPVCPAHPEAVHGPRGGDRHEKVDKRSKNR